MKAKFSVIATIVLFFLLTACQPGQIFGPTVTPTPTLEQAYCNNLFITEKERTSFVDVNDKLLEFLLAPTKDVPNSTNGQYLDFIQLAVSSGWLFSDEPILPDAIPVFTEYEETSRKLQIALNREVVPPKLEFVHSKIMSCIDVSIQTGSMYLDLIEKRIPLPSSANFSACKDIKLYYDEIKSFCDKN